MESSEAKQRRHGCNVGKGLDHWSCYTDCAFWDRKKCGLYETESERTMEKLYPKSIELTKNLIRQMKDVEGASISLEAGEQLIGTIEAQQQEIDRLNYTLLGVMHSVDKWFDEIPDDMDEVNRAVQAREIALQEIEKLKDQNDTLAATVNMFAPYIIGKKESEVVEELKELLTLKHQNQALTADKDRIDDDNCKLRMTVDLCIGRIKQVEKALECLHNLLEKHEPNWYLRKHHNMATNALLGGKEDANS